MSELFGFLYARPSFIEGVARALDLGGTLQEYNNSPTGEMADRLALEADLQTVTEELKAAIAQDHAEQRSTMTHA